MKILIYSIISLCLLVPTLVVAQSFETMVGTERVFIDGQWLKTFDQNKKVSLFNRARATADYEENTNLFTGAYLNYTTRTGLGGTVLGRVSSNSPGADAGIHYFKFSEKFMVYALASVELNVEELGYSWFSILRYTPRINDNLKMYSSLELFSAFDVDGHLGSVQRIRLGLDYKGFQFGPAVNLAGVGRGYENTDTNPGIFVRKQF